MYSEHPKFMMQVYRQEPVPKLVSINQYSSSPYSQPTNNKKNNSQFIQKTFIRKNNDFTSNFYDSRQNQSVEDEENQQPSNYLDKIQYNELSNIAQNSQIQQNKRLFQPSSYYTTLRKQLPVTAQQNYRLQVIQLQKLLEIQKQQKHELHQIIKELTLKSEKLQQVNEHIVSRLRDIQKNFVQEKMFQQNEIQNRIKKAITQVYQDVQFFVRSQVQQLTQKLKGQRMTPLVERKLELFMETLLQLNQNTVEMYKLSKNNSSEKTSILSQFLSTSKNQKESLTRSKVQNRLNRADNSYSSYYNRRSNSNKREQSASSGYERRLINNAYISSYKKKTSPSKLVMGKNNDEIFQKQRSKIKENQKSTKSILNLEQNTFEEYTEGHISLLDRFKSLNEEVSKRRDSIAGSFQNTKNIHETSGSDIELRAKEFTPNRRKKIFDESQNSKSKTKYKKTLKQ